ncbi:MAG: sigma-70 family RNA polymerase sigma factor [Acidobacteriota bacterium]
MARGSPAPDWPDKQLVEACLAGSDTAWHALIDKYKKLVYAVIMKYRPSREESADLFQAVWLDVYNDLGQLRNQDAVKPWLISLVRNVCYHWKQKQHKQQGLEIDAEEPEFLETLATEDPTFAAELERDQMIREAILELPERCREMVHLLFFHHPPLPYKEVADLLGLALGSIGFIRGRCLKKLQKAMEALGFEDSDFA